jgi:hypothetical protein
MSEDTFLRYSRDSLEEALRVVITGRGGVNLAEDGIWRVPKAVLVRSLLTALESQRLRIARGLRYGDALM